MAPVPTIHSQFFDPPTYLAPRYMDHRGYGWGKGTRFPKLIGHGEKG